MLRNLRRTIIVSCAVIASLTALTTYGQVMLRPSKQIRTAAPHVPSDSELEYLRRVLGDDLVAEKSTTAHTARSASGAEKVLLASTTTNSRTKASNTKSARPRSKKTSTSTVSGSNAAATSALIEKVSLQAALDRAGFSPGIIDGSVGGKTMLAVKTFQNANGLPITGQIDEATSKALNLNAQAPTIDYVITPKDEQEVGPSPTDWMAKSKLSHLGFKSLDTVVAFHGHCTRQLLARLNPGMRPQSLKAGDVLKIPNVATVAIARKAMAVEIDFDAKTVKALGSDGKPVGLFHCSIAKDKQNRPAGPCTVAGIVTNPKYLFKPESWPEVKNVKENLIIPPGPTNPVGLCWIGLSLKGYGIHGTPEPEMIGKTGSHGCFRLTNWDALRLADMISIGIEVRFIESTTRVAQAR